MPSRKISNKYVSSNFLQEWIVSDILDLSNTFTWSTQHYFFIFQEYAQRQQVRQVMVTFKRYVEAHAAIKATSYQRLARWVANLP